MKLTTKLILAFVLTVIIPVIVFYSLNYRYTKRALKNEVLDTLIFVAEAQEGFLCNFLDAIRNRAIDFSSDGFLQKGVEEMQKLDANDVRYTRLRKALTAHLRLNKKSLDKSIRGICIIDLNGKIIVSTDRHNVNRDISISAYFKQGLRGAYVSDVFLSYCCAATKYPYQISVTAPLMDKRTKTIYAVITNDYSSNVLNKILSGQQQLDLGAISSFLGRRETFDTYLVNREKLLITPSKYSNEVMKQRVETLPVVEAAAGRETSGIYKNYLGAEVIGASMYFPSNGWTLCVEMSTKEVFIPLVVMRNRIIILGIPTVLLAIFLAYIFSKRTHGALRESEERFKAFMDNNPAVAFMKDERGYFIYINATYMRIFKTTMENYIGKTDFDLWPVGVAKQLLENDKAVLSANKAIQTYEKIPTPDGILRDWLVLKFPVKDRSGSRYLGGVAIDITEQKRAELEYKTVLSTAMDGFWFTDTEGRLLDVNDASCRLSGYSREELLTMRVQDIEDKETQEVTTQHIKKIMETGYARFETRHRCKDGKVVDIEVSVNYVEIAGGRFFAFLRDITERKKSEVQIRLQLQHLAVVSNIDKVILSTLDMHVVLEAFMDRAFPQLHVDAADILLFNPYMQTLEYAVGRGFHTSAVQRTRVRLGEGCCGQAAVERRPVFIHNLREESCVRSKQLPEESFVSHYAAPLIAKGQVNGVLEVFHRAPFAPEQEWLNFLETLAGQAAIAIDNAMLFEGLQHANTELVQAYDATIEGWSHALDLRDKETEGHSLRVTEMTVLMAANMGVSKADLIHVRRGSLLHDIGKMGVPDNILLKIDKLTDEEWILMRKHPVYAYELLSRIAYLRPALDIPYSHHEKWDGTGYPRGLKGEEIPLSARIFAVVDVWDAMRSDRPYRKGWVEEKVREHIKSLAGTHFDLQVVEAFLKEKW